MRVSTISNRSVSIQPFSTHNSTNPFSIRNAATTQPITKHVAIPCFKSQSLNLNHSGFIQSITAIKNVQQFTCNGTSTQSRFNALLMVRFVPKKCAFFNFRFLVGSGQKRRICVNLEFSVIKTQKQRY